MNQRALFVECQVPERGTMTWDLLVALKNGERLTPLTALSRFNCLSLSQRMGELRRAGWPIEFRMVKVNSGKSVAQYHLRDHYSFAGDAAEVE